MSSLTQIGNSCLVAVCPDPPGDLDLLRAAARLSVDLDLQLLPRPRVRGVHMLLAVTPQRIELRVVGGEAALRGGRAVYVDLMQADTASPAGRRLRQPIARALGLTKGQPPPTVIDATAGWGQDAWLAASLGCAVLAVERNAIVAALLRDGLMRAAADQPEVAHGLHIVHTDAAPLLHRMARRTPDRHDDLSPTMSDFWPPDVVYLDPMFPAGRKTAERKAMRVLRKLVGDDNDAAVLFSAAMKAAKRRVVVKRPLRAEPLAGKPTSVHKGKAMRYDVYLT